MSDLTGTLIDGRYRALRKVGEGGSSTVYAGEHVGLGVAVAVKVLRTQEPADMLVERARADRFLEEARVLERLRHPNIVASLGAGYVGGNAGGAPYIALTWCTGPTLAERLAATRGTGARSLHEVWEIMLPIVDAVAHAHAQGIAHCDLTPSNVMLDTANGATTPRIIDFGVADHAARAVARQASSPRQFTLAYAAPEQVTGAATGSFTDVHALALVFLELLANKPPYGESEPELAIVDPERPSPRRLGVDAGPFAPVLDKALRLDPGERFADAGELEAALRFASLALPEATTTSRNAPLGAPPALGDISNGAASPVPGSAGRRRGRTLVAISALGGLAAIAAVATGVWWWGTSRGDARSTIDLPSARSRLEAGHYRVLREGRFGVSESLALASPRGATVDVAVVPGVECRERDVRACEARIRDKVIRDFAIAARSGFSVAFAADRTRTLTAWSLDPESAHGARDVAVQGLGVPVLGVVTPHDRPSGEGRTEARLASFGPDELATQLRAAGLVVPWSGEGQGDLVAMATYQDGGGALAMAYLYKGPMDAILKSLQAEPEALVWARSPERLLVLRGAKQAASAAVLEKVVAGLDAVVGGSP